MSIELENQFFGHFSVSDREKELLIKFKDFQQFISRTKSLPFFLCSIKDCEGLKKCVNDGFDINTNINGDSLLSIAIANTDDGIVSYLLDNGFAFTSDHHFATYFALSIEKSHRDCFDTLIKICDRFALSDSDTVKILRQSVKDIYFITKIVELGLHINSDGHSLINDAFDHWVKTDVLDFLISHKIIDTEKCNELYVQTAKRGYRSDPIERLRFLSPHCNKINNLPDKFEGEEDFEKIKFLLADEKYSNYDWIVNYFSKRLFEKTNKTEILKFILDSNLGFELLSSIMFPAFKGHNGLDLEVLLDFIDRFDANSLNRVNDEGNTVIHEILKDPYGNTAAILERAIANGYDANTPSIQSDWDDGEEITKAVPALEFFFNEIEFSEINEENSKKIVYLLLNHTALSNELIDKMIALFHKKRILYNENDCNFLKYLNSVFEGRSECPSFLPENYSEEIIKNQYVNLLPQMVKDSFIF
jgi:hypothetical protein